MVGEKCLMKIKHFSPTIAISNGKRKVFNFGLCVNMLLYVVTMTGIAFLRIDGTLNDF